MHNTDPPAALTRTAAVEIEIRSSTFMDDGTAIGIIIGIAVVAWMALRRRFGRFALEGKMATFIPVAGASDLDLLFSASSEAPVVLYLHDPYCPVSARAFGEVDSTGGDIHVVDVSRQRDLSKEIQTRTGVRHESPQAFVLRDGTQVWNASHGQITAEAIESALTS